MDDAGLVVVVVVVVVYNILLDSVLGEYYCLGHGSLGHTYVGRENYTDIVQHGGVVVVYIANADFGDRDALVVESEDNLVGHIHCLVVEEDSSEEGKKLAVAVVAAHTYPQIKKAGGREEVSKRRLKRVRM